MSDLRERVDEAINRHITAECCGCPRPDMYGEPQCCGSPNYVYPDTSAIISISIAIALEEAARLAEGPVYRTSGTGEVAIRGTDKGNWSVPMPILGYKGSDYGTGRYDAAAAIRAMIKPPGSGSEPPSRQG